MSPFTSNISGSGPPTTLCSGNHEPPLRQLEERLSQINFVRPAQMSLFANVACWPPLGQVTFLKRKVEETETGDRDKVCHPQICRRSSSFGVYRCSSPLHCLWVLV